jgi:trans-cinnamate 4-monooxygenase
MPSLIVFCGEVEGMVFTIYGEHWRRRRRIMTVPSPTRWSEVHSFAWENEADHVIKDLKAMPEASTLGVTICERLQLMMYNIIYRLMFNS